MATSTSRISSRTRARRLAPAPFPPLRLGGADEARACRRGGGVRVLQQPSAHHRRHPSTRGDPRHPRVPGNPRPQGAHRLLVIGRCDARWDQRARRQASGADPTNRYEGPTTEPDETTPHGHRRSRSVRRRLRFPSAPPGGDAGLTKTAAVRTTRHRISYRSKFSSFREDHQAATRLELCLNRCHSVGVHVSTRR